MKAKNRYILFTVAILTSLLSIGIVSYFYNPIVFIVGNKVLRTNEWKSIQLKAYGSLNKNDSTSLLNTWGLEELVLQKAAQYNIKVSDEIVKQYSSKISDNELSEQQLSRKDSEDIIKRNYIGYMMKNFLTKNDAVSDDEILNFYNQNLSDYYVREMRSIRKIKGDVYTLSENNNFKNDLISSDIKGPETFEEFSKDMGEEAAKIIFEMNQGEVRGPVKISSMQYRIKLESIEPAKTLSFEQVKTKIKNMLLDYKHKETMNNWLKLQRSTTRFESRESNLYKNKFVGFLYDLSH